MILSGLEIQKEIEAGNNIKIDPFSAEQLNPNSYNLRLHDELLMYNEVVLDMKRANKTMLIKIPESGMILTPRKLYLGRTAEYTETKNYIPMLEGRSSVGRLGLCIHATAGFGDIGFKGYWTLEIFCIEPVRVYPFVNICQIYYHSIVGDYREYSSKYQGNTGIQPSFMYKDFQ